MPITASQMQAHLAAVLGLDPSTPQRTLEEYVARVPGLDSLANLPSGSVVLVRGDVDAKVGAAVGEGDIRLRSMVQTLQHGRDQGWVQVVFGHIGRKPEGSLAKVAGRLGELLGCEVPLIADWYDEAANTLTSEAVEAVSQAAPGTILVLENTRKYPIETALWKAQADDLPALSQRLAGYASALVDQLGVAAYVHEAFSAGSLDSSSVVAPAAVEHVVLGAYAKEQFTGPMLDCRKADVVVFSGLKIDKLDDLEAIVDRGAVRRVIAAGSLAMSLKKAAAELDGQPFSLGLSQHPDHRDKPYFIPDERIAQAKKLIEHGRKTGIEFVLPVDFVLADGSVVTELGENDQQFDVGPATSDAFEQAAGTIIAEHEARMSESGQPMIVFHNGVFGKFEDPMFERGTKHFVGQLKRLHDAGVKVYIGGGEGGAAAERYGNPETDVTHVFTAGGTVLNALGSQPVPYLQVIDLVAHRG